MEKRLILAVLLMSSVIIITNLLFPPEPPPAEPGGGARDTAAVVQEPSAPAVLPDSPAPTAAESADTVVVRSPLYHYAFSTRGAALLRAELLQYESYVEEGEPVQLVPRGTEDFLTHRLVVDGDTLDLGSLPFAVSESALQLEQGGGPRELQFTYQGEQGFGVQITYTFQPDRYVVGVDGEITGLNGRRAVLLTEVGTGIAAHEHPAHHSERALAAIAGGPEAGASEVRLQKVEQQEVLDGPFAWAGLKDKYFLAALVSGEGPRIGRVTVTDLPDAPMVQEDGDTLRLPRARVTTTLPVTAGGTFAFQAYLGPQEHDRLAAVGYDLPDVNPFGYRWLRPVIRPIAAAILWVLNLLHDTLGIGYGWVLIIFGLLMRVVLWPLNAKAMRAQLKNMAVQPLMQEIREKYKDDPQKQQEQIMRLVREHGFNPLAGCLPLLIPFPVLITLFFVFQDSIQFRGQEFLWLPDLSLPDPYYLLPIFLVVSMFALQWISAQLSGMEQNPQMKMMMYFMPLVMGFIFFNFASGLNLYYAVTNVATIPQQVLIAKERRRAQEAMKESPPSLGSAAAKKQSGGGGKQRKRKAKGRG